MSALDPEPAFATGDDFLWAATAVIAARHEIRGALARLTPATRAGTTEPTATDDPVLCAILGVLHLVERLGTLVESWGVDPAPSAVDEPAAPPEGLLR
jgi:hypothetical protein